MTEAFHNISSEDMERTQDEFSERLAAVQEEIKTYLSKHYPVKNELPKETQCVLNMSLGSVLVALGIEKIKDAGRNPMEFLEDLIRQAKLLLVMEGLRKLPEEANQEEKQ